MGGKYDGGSLEDGYYYSGHPYTLAHWNTLIENVNIVLENPPFEPNPNDPLYEYCQPIEPLEYPVEAPHVWKREDVEEVREKLRETCPAMSFEEDLEKPWREAVIDEIVDKLFHEDGDTNVWCDCTGDVGDEGEGE